VRRLQTLANGTRTHRAVHPFSIASRRRGSATSDVIAYRSGGLQVVELDPRREQTPVECRRDIPDLSLVLPGGNRGTGLLLDEAAVVQLSHERLFRVQPPYVIWKWARKVAGSENALLQK
jgi:hypothetical protein